MKAGHQIARGLIVPEMKVLIVDDDLSLFERMQGYCMGQAPDVTVLSAISGARAQAIAASQRPDAIVIDADMPDADGYLLASQLCGERGSGDCRVIMLSSTADAASDKRAQDAQVSAQLPVSADPHEILHAIRGGSASPAGNSLPAVTVGDEGSARRASAAADGGLDAAAHSVDDLLQLLLTRDGSDLHLTVGSPPGLRIRGEIVPVEQARALRPKDTQDMILALLSEEQRRRFDAELELDFAYSIPGLSRFRANVFLQRNSMGAVFRRIPLAIPTLAELGLPPICQHLCERPRGLVLVTGPTGSGKSTTLAAMIDHINSTRPVHIVTLEDPIEFMHRNKRAYVNQREIGVDTRSFASALRRVLRQDPDVILVGEMRDLETISAAITAAETGHLVLATLHTTGGPETVDRIIDVFPPHQQQQVRMQLSATLEGVLSQVLFVRRTASRARWRWRSCSAHHPSPTSSARGRPTRCPRSSTGHRR
jgi:twitching motility protein PilT